MNCSGVLAHFGVSSLVLVCSGIGGCGGDGFLTSVPVDGETMVVQSTVFFVDDDGDEMAIMMSTVDDLCKVEDPQRVATLASFELQRFDTNLDYLPLETGVYHAKPAADRLPGNTVDGQARIVDVAREVESSAVVSSGTVRLDDFSANDGGRATGAIDVTFGSESASGKFVAEFCSR